MFSGIVVVKSSIVASFIVGSVKIYITKFFSFVSKWHDLRGFRVFVAVFKFISVLKMLSSIADTFLCWHYFMCRDEASLENWRNAYMS